MNPQASPISTHRLNLEPLNKGHATEMVDVLASPSLYEFMGGEPPTLDQLVVRYDAQVEGSPDPEELWFNWIVRLSNVEIPIGFVQSTVNGSQADVAWVIGQEFQGRGYAVEAARGMVDWLDTVGVKTMFAHIHPDHHASHSVASKLGFERSPETDEDGEEIWVRNRTGDIH